MIAYQKSAGDLNYQLSAFGRQSSVHFQPDPVGDLYFNGVASDVARTLRSVGWQGDGSSALTPRQTIRAGFFLLDESVTSSSVTTVFPVDDDGDPDGRAFSIADDHRLYGLFAGLYVQDEWKITRQLTVNFGARGDLFQSSFDREDQISPRVNLVDQPTATTTLHAGYARYFTPPPVENVSGSTVAKNSTAPRTPRPRTRTIRSRAERSDYFDDRHASAKK